jgi:hypothetical protein
MRGWSSILGRISELREAHIPNSGNSNGLMDGFSLELRPGADWGGVGAILRQRRFRHHSSHNQDKRQGKNPV